jgi:hypothetical protein
VLGRNSSERNQKNYFALPSLQRNSLDA